jgi:hypothetical protein
MESDSEGRGLHKEAFQTVFRQILNPNPNPQHAMSCTISAYVGSPRGLVSRCNTTSGQTDKGEVGGSSPPRPTIQINAKTPMIALQAESG